MKTEPGMEKWCNGASLSTAPLHHFPKKSLKSLAFNALDRLENGAREVPIKARLHQIAMSLGIPAGVVDELPLEELEATAEQAALCEGGQAANGDPLAVSLLVFYLKSLAGIHK